MKNSPIEIADALNVLGKLIARTREGKLSWDADGESYTTTFGPNLRVTVSESNAFDFSLAEFDAQSDDGAIARRLKQPDKEVLNVSIEKNPAYGFDTIEEKKLTELLRDLLVLARRSALDINSSMQRALTYLDKIAG